MIAAQESELAFALLLPYFPPEVELLILDPSVSDLMFTAGRIFVDRAGSMSEVHVEMNPRSLNSAIESIARRLGKDIDDMNPVLDARLPDGSRVAAVFAPCAIGGSTMTIRKFCRHFTMDELVERGSVPPVVASLIQDALPAKKNILFSGGTGSGKTTTLNASVRLIPDHERLIVIENPAEMKIFQPNVVRWEAIEPLPDRPAVTPAQLIKAALRHRPDRIILGEVRDASAYDLLQAMNTGHSGTFSTIHAESAVSALYRLSGLATSAFPNLDQNFMRQETAAAIHYVIHIERSPKGRRAVKEAVRVTGYEQGAFQTEALYKQNEGDFIH